MRLASSIKSEEFDKSAGRVLSTFLILNSFNLVIKQIFTDSLFVVNYLTLILGFVYLVHLVLERKYILLVIYRLILIETVVLILIISSMLINSSVDTSIFSMTSWLLIFCIPLLTLASNVSSKRIFLETTKIASFIVLILFIVRYFYYLKYPDIEVYNISLGYALLFPTLFHISKIYDNKLYFIPVVIEIFIIIRYGSRGPLLSVFAFTIILFLFFNKTLGVILKRMMIGVYVLLSVIISKDVIVNIISINMQKFNISSRTLELLISSRFLYDSGRSDVWDNVYLHVLQKPVLGWGVAGQLNFIPTYPHNIFLDFMLHFGLIIGIGLSLYMTYRIILAFKISEFKDISLIIFLCAGLFPLFLSDTYLQAPLFWVLIGLCHSFKQEYKYELHYNKDILDNFLNKAIK